jgi:hypothetical protein
MEAFLRDKVDLQALSGKTFSGDAQFFEDAAVAPPKIRSLLDSSKVCTSEKLCLFTICLTYFFNFYRKLIRSKG